MSRVFKCPEESHFLSEIQVRVEFAKVLRAVVAAASCKASHGRPVAQLGLLRGGVPVRRRRGRYFVVHEHRGTVINTQQGVQAAALSRACATPRAVDTTCESQIGVTCGDMLVVHCRDRHHLPVVRHAAATHEQSRIRPCLRVTARRLSPDSEQ